MDGKLERTESRIAVPDALDPRVIDAIVQGRCGDPFAVLGPHADSRGLIIRAFVPGASRLAVVDGSGTERAALSLVHQNGLFAGPAPLKHPWRYRLRAETSVGDVEFEDPYRFPPILGEFDLHLIREGNHLQLYERLGAHATTIDGVDGVTFAVWAPNAERVSVVGDFNQWDGRRHPMRRRIEAGVWELFIPGLPDGLVYKFEIRGYGGRLQPLKADPFAFCAEHPPHTASRIHIEKASEPDDDEWLARRAIANARNAPISIYECHLGSWRRNSTEGNRYLSYAELADQLVPYVKDLGFTHLELLPIAEYPFDGSWGYQPTGLYAPTSRFGTPDDFRSFITRCHNEGLAVIVDWVPGHFPNDAHGLETFDGTHLYEHADPRLGFHKDWNTLIYNYGRPEVANFLHANALFWLERYRIDGLRVDAVASMLYLDYSRAPGEWLPNRFGGRENLEAVAFLRKLNEITHGQHPGIAMIAEESTAWPGVSQPVYAGGLGFGYKWNMGWMHDTLRYMAHEPVHRRWHHSDLTFGLLYAFSENFILPLSHDEVVHGKGSLLSKMPGDPWQRFANLRAYYGFMFAHPGKKLLFMGAELAQEREWNHDRALDWHLLDRAEHRGVQTLIRDLNTAYRTIPALHLFDCEERGFEWIEANDSDDSIIAFLRRGADERAIAVTISNFTPIPRPGYRVGVPYPGLYIERINTDSRFYGGSDLGNAGPLQAQTVPHHGRPYSLTLTVPPLATLILEHVHE
jgi:1,4-alpha-glucan branching enzyme